MPAMVRRHRRVRALCGYPSPIVLVIAILAASLAAPWQPMPSRAPENWWEARLSASTPDDARLIVRGFVASLDVFVEDAQVYAFRDERAAGRLTLHVIELPRGSAGKRVFARFPTAAEEPYISGTRVVSMAESPFAARAVLAEPLAEDVDDLVAGAVILAFGLLALIVAAVRRRGDSRPLVYFGAFAFLYGVRLLVDSALFPLTGAKIEATEQLQWLITYVITIPGWALARRLIGDGRRNSLRWQVWAFILFAPIGIVSDLLQRQPGSMEAVNNLLVVAGGINILLNLILVRHRREVRIVLAGSIVFMLFALANNLASLGVLPLGEVDETPGFVIFLGTLGFAAARRFAASEREQIELQSELTAAREIQRSILPSSMPRAAGLRFDARYVPATSVAGDLYDLLEIDERRVGVLVADVAGHGIPAALIASMVKVAVTSQARLADDPPAMLRELNAILTRDVRRGFVTATYLYFDGLSLQVANAGHPAPLLLRGNEIRELGAVNPLLGRFRNASYAAAAIDLQPGDRIVAYTDGITEALNGRSEAFGEERLHALMRERADIIEAVLAWRGRASDADDLTLVTIDVAAELP
jgi:sigma-B regulation protein RsbU (phosphoserine phosphatase)